MGFRRAFLHTRVASVKDLRCSRSSVTRMEKHKGLLNANVWQEVAWQNDKDRYI